MRASGMRGDVLVDFVVDSEGRVTRAYVVRSLNPAFDEPALEAVRRWKFEPGRKGGVHAATLGLQEKFGPQRVFDTRRKAFTDFETMLADLARQKMFQPSRMGAGAAGFPSPRGPISSAVNRSWP